MKNYLTQFWTTLDNLAMKPNPQISNNVHILCLHTAGVTGSIPVPPTSTVKSKPANCGLYFFVTALIQYACIINNQAQLSCFNKKTLISADASKQNVLKSPANSRNFTFITHQPLTTP
jgi:hypothetical protein